MVTPDLCTRFPSQRTGYTAVGNTVNTQTINGSLGLVDHDANMRESLKYKHAKVKINRKRFTC